MKRFLLSLVLFVGLIKTNYAQTNIIVNTLLKSYKLGFIIKGKDSVHYQNLFFHTFPSNFKSFNAIYGWNDKIDKVGPLYNSSQKHIDRFFSLKCIEKDSLTKKIINITIDGVWDADAISYFQSDLIQFASVHAEDFNKVLETYSDKNIISVWTFYFDYENNLNRKKSYNEKIKQTLIINKKMIGFIKAGYLKSSKRWYANN